MKHTRLAGLFFAGALAACSVESGSIDDDDGGTPDAGPTGPISVSSLGSETLTSDGVEVTVPVPLGAQSFAVVVDGMNTSELMISERVTTPSGTVVFDFENDISINRTDATDRLYTLLVSNNPSEVAVEAGDWLLRLRSGSDPVNTNLTLITKNEPAADNLLDLNLYFVGLTGLDATTAETDPGFQAILSNVGTIYESAGFGIRAITYNEIEGADADEFSVVDPDADVPRMFQLSPSGSNQSLNMFFVEDIESASSGFSVLGLAGGVPGPPILQGTSRSGVAVSMGSYLAAVASGDQTMIDTASAELEIVMAHESGHFLGLYHTTERNGVAISGGEIQGEDPLSDTPACPDSADADGDGVLSPSECAGQGAENLMFWSPLNDSRTLTTLQGTVMRKSPLVH